MKEREYRKLNISDLELVLEMNKNFRDGFIFKENVRQFFKIKEFDFCLY
ncbi:MAG: hypothetical protein GX053_01075 [Tissierella sp.]|nr:hypothetical protein [Tissierella sp.]